MCKQSIIRKMMQESNEADDGLAARRISPGEWITVHDNRDQTYTWYHSLRDVNDSEEFGALNKGRNKISEEKAVIFLFDVTE